ncbi:GON domain-containing protein [Amycolatopsis rhabdoformis]|uniref:GON domain-containing protein n=1 Tax=Amycolatopsis rhabdoformis TaxID=1448059 RepID=A0ABZ1IBP5_9PSEU|nr:GON domain-containing protein [Amycolatopsis rhabdoformis]WSE31842.1 GON domain-containing protein [Amycolatopsis rhabdoformis]
MFRRFVVAAAVLVFTGLAVTPASAQPVVQPAAAPGLSSCAAIRALLPIAGDGNYVLNTGSHLVPVYCHDMAGTPKEYVTLTAPNFSQYTIGGVTLGTNVRTTFTRVRIDPATLLVDINDLTFATSTGSAVQPGPFVIESMPYAVAGSCDHAASGIGRVDLAGTAFVLAATWVINGFEPRGGATLGADGRSADLAGGGYCGSITPAPAIYSPVNPTVPDFHLQLACGPHTLVDVLLGRACVNLT